VARAGMLTGGDEQRVIERETRGRGFISYSMGDVDSNSQRNTFHFREVKAVNANRQTAGALLSRSLIT